MQRGYPFMTINQKLEALGFDPSNHDAAVHSALDELAERAGFNPDYTRLEMPDAATRVKTWWTHVKDCDACVLARPHHSCGEGRAMYHVLMARVSRWRPTRLGSVRVEHKDLILSRSAR